MTDTSHIIGGDGMVGTALCRALLERGRPFTATSRRRPLPPGRSFLDLAEPKVCQGLRADVLYLVAAVSRVCECEAGPLTYQVNARAPILLARHYLAYGSFVVFISTDLVERASHLAYARQKERVEIYLEDKNAAVISAARIAPERADEFARFVVDIAASRQCGVTRWK